MFVFLSKLLPPFVYPLGLACLLILLSLLIDWRSARGGGPARLWNRLRRGALALALLVLVVGGNRGVAAGLARSLEWRYLPPAELPVVDAIVLLGGGTSPQAPPRPMVELDSAGDRVLYAAQLYRQGKAPWIISSGGSPDWSTNRRPPAEDMAELLVWMGVPQPAILLQPRSRNTHEDAVYSAEILRQRGLKRILLVTSAWHMPRSLALFQAQGLDVTPAPTDFTITQQDENAAPGDWRAWALSLFPSIENLSLTTKMLREYIGLWVYHWRGWY